MNKKAKRYLLILAGIIVFAAFVGFQFYREWQKLQSLEKEKAAQTVTLDAIKSDNQTKQQELEDSATDAAVERAAREVLGWVKKGDIKIVDKDK